MSLPKIAYAGLRAEMGRYNLSIQNIAMQTGMNPSTLGRKLSRKQPLKLDEAFLISSAIPNNNELTYLFSELQDDLEQKESRP